MGGVKLFRKLREPEERDALHAAWDD